MLCKIFIHKFKCKENRLLCGGSFKISIVKPLPWTKHPSLQLSQLTGVTSFGGGAISYTDGDLVGGTSYKGADPGMFLAPEPVWDPVL